MGGIQFSSSLKLKLSVCQPLPDIHPNSRKIDLPGFKWEKNSSNGPRRFNFWLWSFGSQAVHHLLKQGPG